MMPRRRSYRRSARSIGAVPLVLAATVLAATVLAAAVPARALADGFEGLVHQGPIHEGRDFHEIELNMGMGGSTTSTSLMLDVGMRFRQRLFGDVYLWAGGDYVFAHVPETDSGGAFGGADDALNLSFGRVFVQAMVPIYSFCKKDEIRIEVSRDYMGSDAYATYYKVKYVDRDDVQKKYTLSVVAGHTGLWGPSSYYPQVALGLRFSSWAAGVFKLTPISGSGSGRLVEFNRFWYVELVARYGGFGSATLAKGHPDRHTFSVTASLSGIWLFGILPICFDIGAAHTFALAPPEMLTSRASEAGWAFFGMWRFPMPLFRHID